MHSTAFKRFSQNAATLGDFGKRPSRPMMATLSTESLASFALIRSFLGTGPLGRGSMYPAGVARVHTLLHSSADRKSTRLNSSHQIISYAVFCLKKKKCC